MSMTRVAIAGTGGLAYLIANYVQTQTTYPIVLLSKEPNEELTSRGFDVLVVDFTSPSALHFALFGSTVLICTIPGPLQITLIDAAIKAGVSRFAPAEFSGLPSLRPQPDDLDFDGSRAAVLNHLFENRSRIEYTCFVCGILYEHFAPDGLYISSRIGHSSPISAEGSYLMNIRAMTGEAPRLDAVGDAVMLRLTAGQDVGRFVVRALDLESWPPVLCMAGERLSTQQLVQTAERVRRRPFFPNMLWRDDQSLHGELGLALAGRDTDRYRRLLHLLATQEGRFDFEYADLNELFPDVQPLGFGAWLERVWADE